MFQFKLMLAHTIRRMHDLPMRKCSKAGQWHRAKPLPQEYGVSEAQLERAADYVEREIEAARKGRKLVRFGPKPRG
jgi:hypothetical protein